MKVDLNGQVAIVTGGASGIGRAIVQDLTDNGAQIAVIDVNGPGAEQTAKEITEGGGVCIGLQADVSDQEQVNRAVGQALSRFGRADILVNDAGIGNPDRVLIHEQSLDMWNRVIGIDLTGVYLVSKAVIPTMLNQGSGCILNVSSVAGLVPLRLQSAYDAAKAGVANLTRAMAVELGGQGIRVNAVAPGSTLTAGTKTLFYGPDGKTFTERGQSLVSHIPLGRPATTADIAHAALFLVSPEASYITGVVLPVDGGWVAGYVRNW